MKQILVLLTILLAVSGCNSKKIHSIAALTPTLSTNSVEPININNNVNSVFLPWTSSKNNTYTLSKYSITSQPVIAGEKVFSIDSIGVVRAFCLQTKQILWTNNIFNNKLNCTVGGGILYNEGKLYITNGSRYIFVLDAKNGYEIFRKEFPDIIKVSPVLISPNMLLVQTISNQLLTFDIAHSKTLTLHESYSETIQSSYYMNPIVHESNIISSYNSGVIFALDHKVGKERWVINLNELSSQNIILSGYEASGISCPPLVVQDSIYIATTLGQLLKVNLKSGRIIWKSDVSDIQSMSLEGNNIFVTTNANQTAAISLLDGRIKWVASLATTDKKNKNLFYSAPFITSSVEGMKFLTILDNKGKSYNYSLNNNRLSCSPEITAVPKNISYIGTSCLNETFLITNNKIIFIK